MCIKAIVAELKNDYPDITQATAYGWSHEAVLLSLWGVVGGGSKRERVYKVLITFECSLEDEPVAWIVSPSNSDIRHCNVFVPRAPVNMPQVCMGGNSWGGLWGGMPAEERNLRSFIIQVNHILKNENRDSSAR